MRYYEDSANINIADVKAIIEMRKRAELLENHKYDIWEGSDGAWYTYLPDRKHNTSKRKLIRRVDKQKLEKCIIDYYVSIIENPRILEMLTKWNNDRLKTEEIGKNSHTRYDNDIKRFFLQDDEFSNKAIKEVIESDITTFIKLNIKRYNLSRKAYTSLRTLIMGVFKHAKEMGMTNISISTYFSDLSLSKNLFRRNKKSDTSQVFNDDESAALIKYFGNNPSIHNYGLLLMFETGLRIGELCVLKPEHITKDGIVVETTEIYYKDINTGKTTWEIKESPKMGSEDRLVIIPKCASDTIRKIRAMNPFGEFLFMNSKHERIKSIRFNYYLYKACKEVGIPERSSHKIRKTYASRLIDANIEESLIKSQMGHSDIKTTKDYYYYCTQTKQNKQNQISKAINL